MWNEYRCDDGSRRLVATADDYNKIMCFNNNSEIDDITFNFNEITNNLDDVGDALKLLTERLDNLEKKPASVLNYKNEIKNLKTLNYNYRFKFSN